MYPKIEFHKIRGVAEVINTTLEFVRENLKGLLKAVVYISGPFILFGAIIYGYFLYNAARLISGEMTESPMLSAGMQFTLMFTILILAFFFFYSTVYQYINLYVTESLPVIEIGDVWRAIKKDAWLMAKTVLGLILMIIVVAFLFGLGAIVITAIGSVIALAIGPFASVILIFVLYIFLFYLLVPYTLIFNVRINERRRFFDSVAQCHNLVSGNRLRTFGVVFLSVVLQFMLGFILNLPNYAITIININSVEKINLGWINFIIGGIIIISAFVIGMISVVAINLQYFNLVERKNSLSLLNKIEGIGNASPSASPAAHEETY